MSSLKIWVGDHQSQCDAVFLKTRLFYTSGYRTAKMSRFLEQSADTEEKFESFSDLFKLDLFHICDFTQNKTLINNNKSERMMFYNFILSTNIDDSVTTNFFPFFFIGLLYLKNIWLFIRNTTTTKSRKQTIKQLLYRKECCCTWPLPPPSFFFRIVFFPLIYIWHVSFVWKSKTEMCCFF